MKKTTLVLAFSLFLVSAFAGSETNSNDIQSNISSLPVMFRQNVGQWNSNVLYAGMSPSWNANVQFLKGGVSFGFSRQVNEERTEVMVWNLLFENANSNPLVSSLGQEKSSTNYYKGNNPSNWKTNVPDYKYIKYENIYPNTDIQYYGTGKELKYDIILNPGADITNVKLKCEGVNSLNVNNKGELEINTPWGTLIEELPVSYQLINGEKVIVPVSYSLNEDGKSFGFKVRGQYNSSYSLVIDPVNLVWSHYIGANTNLSDGYQYDVAIDANENVYATGYYNDQFPVTAGVYDNTFNGIASTVGNVKIKDVVVYKVNAAGTGFDYATFIGGTNDEAGLSIDVNSSGEVFVAGYTSSSDFPITGGAYYNSLTGATSVFCSKLSANGGTLQFSTFLKADITNSLLVMKYIAIAANNSGEVYIAGPTESTQFTPTVGAYDNSYNGGSDAFLIKLNSTGTTALFATYIGGSGVDTPSDLSLDQNGDVYISGTTSSTDFPTLSAISSTFAGGASDGFVMKFTSAGSLSYATYLGGTATDYLSGIDVASGGEAVVSGYSGSTDYPVTSGVFQASLTGQFDVVISKLNATGSALVFSTYVGSGASERMPDIILNSADQIYFAGYLFNGNTAAFPITSCAYQSTPGGGAHDFYICKMSADGKQILYGSFMGGNAQEYTNPSIVLVPDPTCSGNDDIVFGGTTHSGNFPNAGASSFPSVFNYGSSDHDIHVLSRFTPPTPVADFTYSVPASTCTMPTVQFTDATSNNCFGVTYSWNFGDGSSSTSQNPTHQYADTGDFVVTLTISCPVSSQSYTVHIAPPQNNLTMVETVTHTSCNLNNGQISIVSGGTTQPVNFVWSPSLGTGTSLDSLPAGVYTVTMYDTTALGSGCTVSETYTVNPSTIPVLNIDPTNVTCPGASQGEVNLTVSSGTPVYTYNWNNGAYTSEDLSNVVAGDYTVVVTDAAGCTSVDSVTITQPSLIPITLSVSRNDTVCVAGSPTSLSANASGGNNGLSYSWSTTQTTPNISVSPTSSQYYSVVITDGCGNTKTDSVLVTIFSVGNSEVETSCALNNGAVTVTPSGMAGTVTYSWTPNLGNGNSYVNLSPGTYAVTVTDLGSGCKENIQFVINSSTVPDPSFSFTNVTCPAGNNGTVNMSVVDGTPTYSYNWNNGQYTSEDLTNLSSGTYTIVITDLAGCTTVDSVTITEPIPSPIILSVSQNDTVCAGNAGTANVSATGGINGLSYSWTPGNYTSTNISVTPLADQTYTVVVTDGCGQTKTDSVTVNVEPIPNASASASAGLYYLEDTAMFTDLSTGATTWLWNFGDGSTSNVQNPSHLYGATGTYTVILYVTNSFGCPDSVMLTLEIKQEEKIEVPNVFTPNGDGFNDSFVINNKGVKEYHIIIYDRWGLKMFESTQAQQHWDGVIQSTGRIATDGTYYYILDATFISDKKFNSKGYLQLIR